MTVIEEAMYKRKMIARGRTAEVFAWKDDRVLKLFIEGRTIHSVEHEAQVTGAIRKVGLPVPSVEGIVQVQGRLGIVFERVDGPSMLQVLRSNPLRIDELTSVLAKLHTEIHSHQMPNLPSLRDDLEKSIHEQVDLPQESRKIVLGRLAQLPDGNTICHLDFHPDNIIMSSRGPIVIDWSNVKRGDPLADVAATLLLLRSSPLPQFMTQRWLINILRNWVSSSYLKKYLQLRPVSTEQIELWDLPLITGRLADNIPEEKNMLLAMIKRACF